MSITCRWSTELETGIDCIDQQHRRLVDCIDEISLAIELRDAALVGRVTHEVIDLCTSHNAFEEALMEKAGYPLLEAHRRQHQATDQRVLAWSQQLDQGADPLLLARHIRIDLAIWLTHHIRHDDQHYVPWVKHHLKPGLFSRMWHQLFPPCPAGQQQPELH